MAPEDCLESEVRAALDRLVSSAGFVRNERMSRFLRFVVERHLQARDDESKESVIGIEVFGRRADYDPKQDSIVRTEAARLRARLASYYAGEGRHDPVVIELPKGGYVPRIRHAAALSGKPAPRARTPRTLTIAAATAAMEVVAVVVVAWFAPGANAPISIAVLPLTALSDDSTDAYFADGLTDEIIRNLSAVEGLEVRSRTSAFAFREAPRNVREVGAQLSADYLVEGTVLRDGRRVRINARLVRVRDDRPVWSAQFDRELTDIFAIQDEIARGVVNQFRLNLGHGRWRYETSVEAYDLYLRANSSAWLTFSDLVRSIDLLEQAAAIDPDFAPAFAGLGAAYAIRSAQFGIDHPADELARMRAAALRAGELDPLLAEAHAALGLMHARTGAWSEAEASFRRAIELDPNQSQARVDFAMWFLLVVGRPDEALAELRAAQRADPLSPDVHQALAWVLLSLGRFEEARGQCEAMPPAHALRRQCIGRVLMGLGRDDEAVAMFAQDPILTASPQARGFLGYAEALAGNRTDAERMLAASSDPNERALISAGLGNVDSTVEALERMAVVGPQRVGRYLESPEMALLRGDRRVQSVRQRVGLPD